MVTEQDGRLTAELKDLDDSSMDGRFAFTNIYNGFYQPNGERLVVLQGGVRQADGSLEQLYLESCRVSTNQPYDMTDELAALEKEHCAGYTQKEVSGALKGEAGNSEVKILVEYTKNETPETEGTLTIQVVNRNATPNSFTIVVTGPDDFRKEISSSELTDGQITLSDLKPGTYTVVESGAELSNYTLTTTYKVGEQEGNVAEVAAGSGQTMVITNDYYWLGGDGGDGDDNDRDPRPTPTPTPTLPPEIEIPEETTPLGPGPEDPATEPDTGTEQPSAETGDGEEIVDIDDGETPLGDLPQTGMVVAPVNPAVTAGLVALAFSMAGVGLHLSFSRKNGEEEE